MSESNFGHAKASCYRCGQTSPVIDLDVHIEGEGGLCLCRGCIAEAATLLGYVTEGEAADAVAELALLRTQNSTLEDILRASHVLIRNIEMAQQKFRKTVTAGV